MTAELVPYPARTTGVSAWVDIVAPAAELARQIAMTDFVPKAFREKNGIAYDEDRAVAQVTACILMGAEIGIGPMQSLAKIAIIDGRPAPSAELARALCLSDGHDLWVEEATTTRVVMGGKRANSSHVQKATWTMDDAKKAGLAGKQNWQRYPRQMLLARCSIELARMVAPDSLGGISVFAEELDDTVVPTAGADVIPDVPTQVRASSKRKLAAAPPLEGPIPSGVREVKLPPLPDEEPVVAVSGEVKHDWTPREAEALPLLPDEEPVSLRGVDDEPTTKMISPAQIRKLMATYGDLGIRDRADQKRISADCLDLSALESHNGLTAAQASILIDMLSALTVEDIVDVDGAPYVAGSEPGA
jgi:hypothetical protein